MYILVSHMLRAIRPGALRLHMLRSRALAIMIQTPLLSNKDIQREAALRRRADQAAQWHVELAEEVQVEKRFGMLSQWSEVLDAYEVRRAYVTPEQTVSAFYVVAKKTRLPPGVLRTSLHRDPRLAAILTDLVEGVDVLSSVQLCRVLMGMAYMQLGHEGLLLRRVYDRISSSVDKIHIGDIARTFYALGRLDSRETSITDALMARATTEARLFLPTELHLVATGLRGLRLKPEPLLAELSRTAVDKIADFGSRELTGLLAALGSLDWHHEPLLRAAAAQLPLLVGDMNPRSLCETAFAYAAARLWLAPALKDLAEHAARAAAEFDSGQVVAILSAFGILRWDHQSASPALGLRLVEQAPWLSLAESAIALRALSWLPVACEQETLATILRAVRQAQLPEWEQVELQPHMLQMLGFLCNALQHHGAKPSGPLLELVRELCAPGRKIAPKDALHGLVESRARAQLHAALDHWTRLELVC